MQTNPSRTAAKEKVGLIGLMIARLGFVITFLIGLSRLFGMDTSRMGRNIHMATGLLFLVGTLLAVVRYSRKGAGRGALLGAGLLVLVGFGLGMSLMGGDLFPHVNLVHPLIMICVTVLLEIGAAKAKRA